MDKKIIDPIEERYPNIYKFPKIRRKIIFSICHIFEKNKIRRTEAGIFLLCLLYGFLEYDKQKIDEYDFGIKKDFNISINLLKRFEILNKTNFKCQYCGRGAPDVELQVEHIIPRAKGGTDNLSNLTVACFECNNGKRDKLI